MGETERNIVRDAGKSTRVDFTHILPTRARSPVEVPARAVNLIACLLVNVHSVDLRRNPPPCFAEHSRDTDVLILALSAALRVNSSRSRPLRFATVDRFQDEAPTLCRRDSVQLTEKASQYAEPHRIRRDSLSNRKLTPEIPSVSLPSGRVRAGINSPLFTACEREERILARVPHSFKCRCSESQTSALLLSRRTTSLPVRDRPGFPTTGWSSQTSRYAVSCGETRH